MNKKEIVFSDLKDFDIEQISTEVINEVKAMIYEKYKELGGNERGILIRMIIGINL